MFHLALWEPEIPPNTGNVARLCAATGATLHLIGRLGFRLDERSLRRAGLDYWEAVTVVRHVTFEDFETKSLHGEGSSGRLFGFSTRANRPYTSVTFQKGDFFLFGSESRGLPQSVLARYADQLLRIPMPAGKVRSLNLATAAGIVLYEGLRQLHLW